MLFSSLKNKIIYASDGEKIGKVKSVAVEYNTGKICELAAGSIFDFKSKTISIENIVIKEDRVILTNNAEESNFKNDQKGSIINIKVYTEGGEYLGKIKDFDINTYLWRLAQISVSNQLNAKKSLIVSDDQIVSISAEKIIVKDLIIEEAIPNMA